VEFVAESSITIKAGVSIPARRDSHRVAEAEGSFFIKGTS
jgi:hypothetical protein